MRQKNEQTSALSLDSLPLGEGSLSHQPWYRGAEEHSRERMRRFGRQLGSLLAPDCPSRGHRQRVLAASRILGHQYGDEMVRLGVPLEATIESLIYFRTVALDSNHPHARSEMLKRAGRVLVGVAESYQKQMGVSRA